MKSLYALSSSEQDAWKRWLKAELRLNNSSQQALAIDIFGMREDGTPRNTTEVNRFVAGEESILRRWFETEPERARAVAEELSLTLEQLEAKLAGLEREVDRTAPWHPAFPTVPLADALIPTPLNAMRGSTPEEVACDRVRNIPHPSTWDSSKQVCDPVVLTADNTSSRRIAAEQLRSALERCLEESRRKAIQEAQASGKPLEVPSVRVVVAGPGAQVGALEIVVRVEEPSAEPGLFGPLLTLAEWGPEQGVALARRLAESEALEPRARAHLSSFADRLREHPGWTAPVLEPDLLIRWLAEVARAGCPRDGEQARALLTSAGWRRARAAAPALAEFEEELLDAVFASLATRERPTGEPGSWTRAPRAALLTALAQAASLSLEGLGRAELLELVDACEQRGRGRAERRAALRRAISAPSPEVLLEALVRGGVFKKARGDSYEAAEPELAAAHAARRLRSARAFAQRPERIVDPHGVLLAQELARHGVSWAELLRATSSAPPYLAVDVAALRLAFAWCMDAPPSAPGLAAAWATLLWASSHGFLALAPNNTRDPWPRTNRALLKQVSWRFRQALPLLGLDPVGELEALVPKLARDLVGRWRRTPGPNEPETQVSNLALMGLELRELESREELARLIRALGPAQVHPAKCWEHVRWTEGEVPAVARLQEVAMNGDQDARDMLAGRACLREREHVRSLEASMRPQREGPAEDCWRHLSPGLRLDWALREGPRGEEGWQLYCELVGAFGARRGGSERRELGPEHPRFEDLVELGAAQDRRLVARELVIRVTPGGFDFHKWFPLELAWALVERLELRPLLRSLVRWPEAVVPRLRLHADEYGLRLTWGEGQQHIVLKPRWVSTSDAASEEIRERYARPRLGVEGIVARWRDIAMRAASCLYRLGEPQPLLELWRTTRVALPSDSLRRQVYSIEGFLGVADFPSHRGGRGCPLEALQAIAPEEPDDSESARQQDRMTLQMWGLRRAGALTFAWDPCRAPEIRRALLGLWSLTRRPWAEWPEPVVDWLAGIFGAPVRYAHGEQRHWVAEQAYAAAASLLASGDQEPLRLWVEGRHDQIVGWPEGELAEAERAAAEGSARAVKAWWEEDRTRLDGLWALAEARDCANPKLRAQLRHILLLAGAHHRGFKADAPPRVACPRPYVIRAALEDTEIARGHHHFNWRSPKWAVVIRRQLEDTVDARSRAYWATCLAKTEPGCPELIDALRYWLLEDSAPWAGPLGWEALEEESRWVGGTLELLEVALSMDEDWVTDGLERLWRDGLRRPWIDSHAGYKREEAAGGWWFDTSGFGGPPGVVGKLAHALIERGRGEPVLEAWPPPTEESGDEPARANRLRRWLRAKALPLAPDELLVERLEDWLAAPGSRPFPMDEAWELFKRGHEGLDEVALALAERLMAPNFAMLVRLNPPRALEAVKVRIEAGEDPRYTLLHMLAEMSEPGAAAPSEMVEGRRMVSELPGV
ncbi:MAG: hypothetical protein H6741_13875 [Alphaproteobacteria bacterium]|nr:hypothetical protein [Alphaproteobacteria bacterium]